MPLLGRPLVTSPARRALLRARGEADDLAQQEVEQRRSDWDARLDTADLYHGMIHTEDPDYFARRLAEGIRDVQRRLDLLEALYKFEAIREDLSWTLYAVVDGDLG